MEELSGKQRAKLRSMANSLDTVLFIGKEGITDNVVKEAYDVLEARELVKCAVQNGCDLSAKEACQKLCEKTHAHPVQCIGKRFVIFRESRENKRITLD